VTVTDEALHKYYDEVVAERYTLPEQRRARHILVETAAMPRLRRPRPRRCSSA
jgi:hypothetical protein